MRRALLVVLALAALPAALELGARALGAAPAGAELSARLDELEVLAGAPPGGAGGRPGDADPAPGARDARDGDVALNPWSGFFRRQDRRRLQTELTRAADGSAALAFDVYVIGGCAAPLLGGAPGAQVLAERLGRLPAAGGLPVHVVAFGGVDWKQPQPALWLDWILCLGLEPDAVILIDGAGDLAVEALNAARGLHPTYPAAPRWNDLTGRLANDPDLLEPVLEFRRRQRLLGHAVDRARTSAARGSAFLRGRLVARLEERRRELEEARAALEAAFADRADASLLRGPTVSTGQAPADAAARWADGSRQMRALCEAFGARFVHVLQPALHDPDMRAPTDEERTAATPPRGPRASAVRAGYPLLRTELSRLAAEGTTTVDASGLFHDAADTVFAGDCRCTEDAARRLAEHTADALRAAW